jgi:hypothetical protein
MTSYTIFQEQVTYACPKLSDLTNQKNESQLNAVYYNSASNIQTVIQYTIYKLQREYENLENEMLVIIMMVKIRYRYQGSIRPVNNSLYTTLRVALLVEPSGKRTFILSPEVQRESAT